ncbi:GNAT family N-acetyltransferase [Paracoccus albus]|uniref:GNAT family N-acetyltransferase n=1 Tax=Paracoccus albus TaxID=3017784 RepID=UPI0022F02B5F|nr:GNAT family N-acetyltransferase [Paracoccus albus]WBU60334.1 GNAT family N-acetyltransferase [Paracoccus albus]
MPRTVIAPLRPADSEEAVHVFFDAVHNGTSGVYTAEQRTAWAGTVPDTEGWRHRLDGVDGFSARIEGKLVGFMTLDDNGYIDLAFVRADCARQGVGAELYRAIEEHARISGIQTLTTEASLAAQPFFERMGWHVVAGQRVVKRGVELTNYRMTKALP